MSSQRNGIVTLLLVISSATGSILTQTSVETSPGYKFPESEYFDVLEKHLAVDCNHSPNLTLSFANVILTQIGKDFISSPLISCLELQNLGINDVSVNAFDKLPNLKYVNFTGNKFPTDLIASGSHKKLEILILDSSKFHYQYNGYYEKDVTILGRFPSLKILSIRWCGLQSLRSSNALPSLVYLDLTGNQIEKDDFEWLPQSLEYLNLDNNHFSSLSLSNFKNLSWLSIDQPPTVHNEKPYEYLLSALNFENLTGLRYFSAVYNVISRITRSSFNGNMDMLISLRLSYNAIEYIENGTFDKMTALLNLHLDNNKLDYIPLINAEMKLQYLALQNNKITKLSTGTFSGMSQLKTLYLHNNQISNIERNAFVSLDNLDILTLSNNQLKVMPTEWILAMASLQRLDLEQNNFNSLEDLSLSETSCLKKLYFHKNPLKMLKAYSFHNMPKNVTIYLDLD